MSDTDCPPAEQNAAPIPLVVDVLWSISVHVLPPIAHPDRMNITLEVMGIQTDRGWLVSKLTEAVRWHLGQSCRTAALAPAIAAAISAMPLQLRAEGQAIGVEPLNPQYKYHT